MIIVKNSVSTSPYLLISLKTKIRRLIKQIIRYLKQKNVQNQRGNKKKS